MAPVCVKSSKDVQRMDWIITRGATVTKIAQSKPINMIYWEVKAKIPSEIVKYDWDLRKAIDMMMEVDEEWTRL